MEMGVCVCVCDSSRVEHSICIFGAIAMQTNCKRTNEYLLVDSVSLPARIRMNSFCSCRFILFILLNIMYCGRCYCCCFWLSLSLCILGCAQIHGIKPIETDNEWKEQETAKWYCATVFDGECHVAAAVAPSAIETQAEDCVRIERWSEANDVRFFSLSLRWHNIRYNIFAFSFHFAVQPPSFGRILREFSCDFLPCRLRCCNLFIVLPLASFAACGWCTTNDRSRSWASSRRAQSPEMHSRCWQKNTCYRRRRNYFTKKSFTLSAMAAATATEQRWLHTQSRHEWLHINLSRHIIALFLMEIMC